jgi:hypothetical protein
MAKFLCYRHRPHHRLVGAHPDLGRKSGARTRAKKLFFGALWTAIFVAALMTMLREYAASARNIGTAPIVAGAANAALSILLYFYKIPLDWRLEGWAKTRHSILGALAIGVCGLFALDRAPHERQNRGPCLVAAALCLGFILLTGSRCPMVAIAIASLILTRGLSVRKGVAFAGGILGLIALVAVIAFVFRPTLSSEFLHRTQDRPPYAPRSSL